MTDLLLRIDGKFTASVPLLVKLTLIEGVCTQEIAADRSEQSVLGCV